MAKQVALKILGNNSDGLINFKGMMVGNPFVDYFTITQNEVAIYFYYSLIPISLYQAWTKSCNTLASFSTTVRWRRRLICLSLSCGVHGVPLIEFRSSSSSSSSSFSYTCFFADL
jgi:hypothetical protein